MPSQTSRGRNSRDDRRGAADVIGIAVRQREVVEPPDAGVAQHRRDDPVADVEGRRRRQAAGVDEQRRPARKDDEGRVALPDVDERDVQPAVAARGDERPRLDAGSRPPRTPRRSRRAASRRATPAPALPTDGHAPRHSAHHSDRRRVVDSHDREPRRRRDAATSSAGANRTRSADRTRPAAPTCATHPTARPQRRRDERRSGTTAIPAICATAISGIARKFSAEPGERDAREDAARRPETAAPRPPPRPRTSADRPADGSHEPRGTAQHAESAFVVLRAQRLCGLRDHAVTAGTTTRIASVAPKVRTNAGSATDSGSAATSSRRHDGERVERRAALIERPRAEVDDRHQRRAIDRRAAADQTRVRAGAPRSPRASPSRPSQPASRNSAEQQAGEDRDVAARDRDHVIRARLLQPALHLVVQPGAIADDDGRDDRGRPRAPAADRRARSRVARTRAPRPSPRRATLPRADDLDERAALDRADERRAAPRERALVVRARRDRDSATAGAAAPASGRGGRRATRPCARRPALRRR